MAIGKASNMKVYDPRIQGGFVETLMQQTDAMNAASNNTLRMVSNIKKGDFDYEAMFKDIANIVSRRDTTVVTAATDLPITQDEFISVKLNRKIGPVAQTLDAFRKAGLNPDEDTMMFTAGAQAAKAVAVNYLHSSLLSGVAAVTADSANLINDITGAATKTVNTTALVDTLAKFGDRADSIRCWVMHSKAYYDLVKEQIAANITGVSNFNVATASPISLNRPIIVTDDAALITVVGSGSAAVNNYHTLGLTEDALIAENTEEEFITFDMVTGLENLVLRMQGEYAFNLGVKGYKWDVANGAANPTDTALSTSTNWDKVMDSHKALAGVMLTSE